jgi:hypothetical protein
VPSCWARQMLVVSKIPTPLTRALNDRGRREPRSAPSLCRPLHGPLPRGSAGFRAVQGTAQALPGTSVAQSSSPRRHVDGAGYSGRRRAARRPRSAIKGNGGRQAGRAAPAAADTARALRRGEAPALGGRGS